MRSLEKQTYLFGTLVLSMHMSFLPVFLCVFHVSALGMKGWHDIVSSINISPSVLES